MQVELKTKTKDTVVSNMCIADSQSTPTTSVQY
jgi:hypothetical protein